MTIFSSLEIGKMALRAQYKGMVVSGQNVANANTPGYSRQRVMMEAVVPGITPGVTLSPGRGVKITGVQRVRSEFYHNQLINVSSHKAYWEMRQETFRGVEVIFMEPGEYGLNQHLGDFFDAWHDLSSSPENTTIRTSLRERSITFTRAVQDIYLRLNELRADMQGELSVRVLEVNRLASEIAGINDKLLYINAMQQGSNELTDQLDLALENLSRLVNIQVYRKEGGAVDVFAGGSLLVQNKNTFYLAAETGAGGKLQVVNHRGTPLDIQSGKLPGLLESVNEIVPRMQAGLDGIVTRLVEEVNLLHRAGYDLFSETGLDFFRPLEEGAVPASLQFSLSEEIMQNPGRIAAASEPGQPGNGANSLEIARLRNAPLMNEGRNSIVHYYRGLITAMGVEGQESHRMGQAFQMAEMQLREEHHSVAGVSLDEEMLNMIQYQHAWHAASRFISYVDQMIGTLLHELGR